MLLQTCSDFQNEVQKKRCVKYESNFSSLIYWIKAQVNKWEQFWFQWTLSGAVAMGILGLVMPGPFSPFALIKIDLFESQQLFSKILGSIMI